MTNEGILPSEEYGGARLWHADQAAKLINELFGVLEKNGIHVVRDERPLTEAEVMEIGAMADREEDLYGDRQYEEWASEDYYERQREQEHALYEHYASRYEEPYGR